MTGSDWRRKAPLRGTLEAPVVTDLDLERLWRALMQPLGFWTRRLWIMMIDADNQPVPQLTEIDDIPDELDTQLCEPLMEVSSHLLHSIVPGGSIALLFSRPGRNPMSATDRQVARSLAAAARERCVRLRPTHFANDLVLSVFAADDLLPA
jgi:hypothetical protein